LSHFLIAQLNDGRYAGSQLLSPESIATMQSPGVERGGSGSYGLGWVIAPLGGEPAVWHDGVGVNTHTLLLIQPKTRRGAALLFNSFGIVTYASAYPEIEAGVARLLAGQTPAEAGLSLGRLYGLIDLILAAGLVLAAWPLLRLSRWQRRRIAERGTRNWRSGRSLLRPTIEIGAALAILAAVRFFLGAGLGAQSWGEALAVFPDFVAWVWAVALLLFFTGIGRAILVFRGRLITDKLNATTMENHL
jgi:CubicO group peptidase (beta-lactamase class C family)